MDRARSRVTNAELDEWAAILCNTLGVPLDNTEARCIYVVHVNGHVNIYQTDKNGGRFGLHTGTKRQALDWLIAANMGAILAQNWPR